MSKRPSWNSVRARANKFSKEWKGQGYEKGETALFYRDFFDIFQINVRRVAQFEQYVKLLGNKRGYIDLIWKGVLLVEQKSDGVGLVEAEKQALKYFEGLEDHEVPRYVLLCNFQEFILKDQVEKKEVKFNLDDLESNIESFSFIFGLLPNKTLASPHLDLKAAKMACKLYQDILFAGHNPSDLNCFFADLFTVLRADSIGIFPTIKLFRDFIINRTSTDGFDLAPIIYKIFQVLQLPLKDRSSNLDENLSEFPYIEGDFILNNYSLPDFTEHSRTKLIDLANFDWSQISIDIFGAIFEQLARDNETNNDDSAYFTNEENIKRVLDPLCLNARRKDLDEIKKLPKKKQSKLLIE